MGTYVLCSKNRGLLQSFDCMHKQVCAGKQSRQHLHHRLELYMDLDIFPECMPSNQGIQNLFCIPVVLLEQNEENQVLLSDTNRNLMPD